MPPDAEPPRFERVNADQCALVEYGLHGGKHAAGGLLNQHLAIARK
jgi:hypothetical protein